MVLILKIISTKSFYYPIHEISPLEINPLYGKSWMLSISNKDWTKLCVWKINAK